VREFVEESFRCAGIQISWKGEGVNEIGYDKNSGKEYVFIDNKLFRPSKTDVLIGDNTKAKNSFGFNPKFKFKEIVKIMMENDLKETKGEIK